MTTPAQPIAQTDAARSPHRQSAPTGVGDTVLCALERHAREPARIAGVFVDGDPLTYRDLWSEAHNYARRLLAFGVEQGSVVLVFDGDQRRSIVALVGAMLAGTVPSLMPAPTSKQDPDLFWRHHRALFAHIGEGAIVFPDAHEEPVRAAASGTAITPTSLSALNAAAPAAMPRLLRERSEIALLQHSSGTTGVKKGVALTFEALALQVEAYAKALALGPDARIVSWLPLYHDMGLIATVVMPLTLGLTSVYIDPMRWVARPQTLFEAIAAHRATHAFMPNFAFLHMVRAIRPSEGPWDLTSLRHLVNCSEPCKARAFDAFVERFGRDGVRRETLGCCYAAAETVFAITQTRPGEPVPALDTDRLAGSRDAGAAGRVLSSGWPIDGVEVTIVDETGTALPDGQVGEIVVRAPFLFEGYFRDAPRTARVLAGGEYRTGDLGCLLDGELYVLGRVDDMIIVNGRNLYAHEVEALASETEGVAAGRVVAFPIDGDGASQRLIIVAEASGPADARVLAKTVAMRLAAVLGIDPHDVRVVARGRIAKTTSGKVDRMRNRARYLAREFTDDDVAVHAV